MSSSKPRQPRLRASCDGCFLAKVKCSKQRPLCTRCLTCGIDCRYSPSSRTGKPKSEANSNSNARTSAPSNSVELPALSPPLPSEDLMMLSAPQPLATLFRLAEGWNSGNPAEGWNSGNPAEGWNSANPSEGWISANPGEGWISPPSSTDEGLSGSHSMPGLPMMGFDPPGQGNSMLPADLYGISWSPQNDPAAQFAESSAISATLSHGQRHSQDFGALGHGQRHSQDFGASASIPLWIDPNISDGYIYSPTHLPTQSHAPASYFSSPSTSTTPQLGPTPRARSSSTSPVTLGGSCRCFTACLQSLHSLHNASTPGVPPFDTIMLLNRKAIRSCASMMNCHRCMHRSGTHTSAMLLGTVMGKITSFYKDASNIYLDGFMPHFDSPRPFPAPPGANAFEMEILAQDLMTLEVVYARFKDQCPDLSEDAEVSKAVLHYLGNNMGSTLGAVRNQKVEATHDEERCENQEF